MEKYKENLKELQIEAQKISDMLIKMIKSNSISENVLRKNLDSYLWSVEKLCIKSRNTLDRYFPVRFVPGRKASGKALSDICGSIEVTDMGWVHITLNTLLPSEKYIVSTYIKDTINRLIINYEYELPYFEKAFMGIVEFCNFETHNSLDNDNKGWKMISNILKGRVFEDDTQFILSIGLFAKLSEEIRSEIYVLPPEDGSIFMDLLTSEML